MRNIEELRKESWIIELFLSGDAVCGVCANRSGVGEIGLVQGNTPICLCAKCAEHKKKQHGWVFKKITMDEYIKFLETNETR